MATPLALYLARERKRWPLRVDEYFGGIYLAARDVLVPYWSNPRRLDAFVRATCELTDPIWWYWIEFYHAMKSDEYVNGFGGELSKELVTVSEYAAHLALASAKRLKKKPQLTVEHFMVALVAHAKLKLTRCLLASGINLEKLKQGS